MSELQERMTTIVEAGSGDAVLFSSGTQWHYRDPIPHPHPKR
ncbi:hypothetical protein [Thermomonas sp.]|nr:hypothetical protein [Thermomonas sp.]MDI1253488.1 hypothetical protein [Thermomonas sp.]